LRPERIGVFAPGTLVPAVQAHADGIITSINYHGSATRFTVTADGATLTADTPATAARYRNGDGVRLIWPKSAMIAMEAEA
jgi:ABC-type Fe3+/spermidine/putrescine transport system ATPase subunit